MERAIAPGTVFHFGLFEASPVDGVLSRKGTRVKIQEQPFRLLLMLLERPGEIVTREELRQRLWPEGTYVDFDGSLNVILKRLRAAIDDDPENPRFIETIPRRGYRFIAPVSAVEKGPEKNLLQVPAIAAPPRPAITLDSPAHVIDTAIEGLRRSPQRRRYLMYAASALLVLAVTLGAWLARHYARLREWPSSESTPVQVRKSVAVLGFRNLTGHLDDAWLSTALSEMLSTELAGGEKLRLVSGEDVANLRLSSPWSQTDTLDRSTSMRIGAALYSDVLVLGSYLTIGPADHGQVRLDVRMQDDKTGEILTEVAEVGSTQDLFHLISRVSAKLRDRLGVQELLSVEEAGVLASLPLNPETARFYALGVAKLRDFDALAAKDLLEQAAQADPKFSLVHSMLARAWADLGYQQKRREEAKKALDLAIDLPRAQRMLVEGEYYESLGKQEQAASVYHALFQLFPDNVEYGLRLAAAQGMAGHKSEGLATLAGLRKLPLSASNDPRIDLAEARLVPLKSDSLKLIRAALGKTSRENQRLVYAQGKHDECITLVYGEHARDADAPCKEAYDSFLSAGNRRAAADTLRLIADRQEAEGRTDEALATYNRAVAMLVSLGDHEKTGAVLNNMGSTLMSHGKLDAAEPLFRQAKNHFEEAGDRDNALVPVSNMADLFYLRGQLAAASRAYQQALQMTQGLEAGDPSYLLYRLADLQWAQGDLREAHHSVDEAIESLRGEAAEPMSSALIVYGEVSQAEGNIKAADEAFHRSLQIRQTLGDMNLVAEAEAELADLAISQGQPNQAENLLRHAISQFEKAHSEPDLLIAYVLLSQALLKQDKLAEAHAALQHVTDPNRNTSNPALKLSAEMQRARLDAAVAETDRKRPEAALGRLQSVIATASRLGYYKLEWEAKLALGEIEMKANSSLGQKHLSALASETRNRGFELLAGQAESAISRGTAVVENHSGR